MYARNVAVRLKPNTLSDFSKTLETNVLPILRKQKGFQDEITFAMHYCLYGPSSRMEKVSAGGPTKCLDEALAAKGAETSVTSTPTSKEARIDFLVFVRRRRPVD